MPVAIRAITRLVDADDVNVTPGVGVDEYALTYDHDTAKFVLRAPFAGILATGATTGATAQAQAFTLGVVSPFDAPVVDSTTAWQVRKADKTTAVVTVDTTNARVGIGTTAPGNKFEVVDSAFPVLKGVRTSAATNTLLGALGIEHKTSDNMVDGFGVGLFFNIQDNALATQAIGSIGAFRDGADTEGGIKILAGTNGLEEFVTLKSSGNVGIGTASPATRLDIDAGALTMKEMTAPTGVADKAMLYTKDNGSGKTQLCCKLGDNVEIVLATQA